MPTRETPTRITTISFDPGVSTGVAVVDEDGGVVYGSVITGDPEDIDDELVYLRSRYPGAQVVAESPPGLAGNYRYHTQQIEERIRSVFPDVEWVKPGQWKGHPASLMSDLRGMTQHEKDAVGLARWFRKTRGQSSGGDTRRGGN